MSLEDYAGRRVVVTGCSSGLGLATAAALSSLGAHVIGLSRSAPDTPMAEHFSVDLAAPESIEFAANQIGAGVDCLFNCAGGPPTFPSIEIVKVNFLGPRLLTSLLLRGMSHGGAIVSVGSSIAYAWRRNFDVIREFIQTPDFESGVEWYEKHVDEAGHGYPFSKEALMAWTISSASTLATRGIRINITSPGAIDTPLLKVAQAAFPAELMDSSLAPSGRASTVVEQVGPLLFLNSTDATYISGAELAVDGGYQATVAQWGTAW